MFRNCNDTSGLSSKMTLILLLVTFGCNPASPDLVSAEDNPSARSGVPAEELWKVKELKKSAYDGFRIPSPDRKSHLVIKEDAKGISQIYLGKPGTSELKCLTDTQQPGGPKPDRMKMQPAWHPSGKWIFVAVERDQYDSGLLKLLGRKTVEGTLQCGIWTNMWAMSPDGKKWHRLTDFKNGPGTPKGTPDGYTGPAFTRDGKKAVWSQIVDGNIFRYPFGKWQLILADYEEMDGMPTLKNQKDITPKGMTWNEPGNFSPDNVSLLLTGATKDEHGDFFEGMDQYVLNIKTGALKNLTNSPTVWDEHGLFSPDGEKIIFMSAHPYRSDRSSSKILTCKTEFMLMNKDGTGLTQLTHFRESGHPHAAMNPKNGMAAVGGWNIDGQSAQLSTLVFPKYEYWDLVFEIPRPSKK